MSTTSVSGSRPTTTGGLGAAVRVIVTLGALSVLAQAVFAGLLLTGDLSGRMAHGIGSMVVVLLGLVQLVVAAVAWRKRSTPGWVAGVSAVLLVAEVLQMIVGASSMTAVHVPLGVTIFGGYAMLLAAVWRR